MSNDGRNRKYWIDQSSALSRRINLGWFLQALSAPLLIVSVLGAVATLILRRELSHIPLAVIAISLAACLVITAAVALVLAARRFEKPEQALVRIEADTGLHSALSSANAGISPWPSPPVSIPKCLKWHLPKTLAPPLAAVALLAVGLLVPISSRKAASPAPSPAPAPASTSRPTSDTSPVPPSTHTAPPSKSASHPCSSATHSPASASSSPGKSTGHSPPSRCPRSAPASDPVCPRPTPN